MTWLIYAFAAALAWGAYGAFLHRGQVALGSPLKALLCVGIAYFLIGVMVPALVLASQGQLQGFNMEGSVTATAAGALGAIGAVAIIYAFKSGGLPHYVMPLVFGLAPLINVLVTMAIHPPKTTPSVFLWIGYLLAAGGASMVLYYRPTS